jgi:hypothetical protein
MSENVNEFETISKNWSIRDLYRVVNESKEPYQPRSNFLKDGNDEHLADSYNILKWWKHFFYQLLNVHSVNDGRQTKMNIAELLEHEPSSFEVEIAIEKP